MKKLLFFAALALLIGAGCSRTTGSQQSNTSAPSTTTAAETGYCPKVFTKADAGAQFGGTWRSTGNTKMDREGKPYFCGYSLLTADSANVAGVDTIMIGVTLEPDVNQFRQAPALGPRKDVSGLGNEAFIETSTLLNVTDSILYVRKGGVFFTVQYDKPTATEEDLKAIAQKILTRLP